MNVLKLVDEKDPILKQKLEPFNFQENNSLEISKILIENMKYYNGIGLAANQLGFNFRVFSMIHDTHEMVLFNPELITFTEEKIRMKEGCLSFSGLYPYVLRPKGVSIKYFDENNNPMIANLIGLSARIVLHEFDHLNGITFHDRTSRYDLNNAMKKRKNILRKEHKKIKEKYGSKNT